MLTVTEKKIEGVWPFQQGVSFSHEHLPFSSEQKQLFSPQQICSVLKREDCGQSSAAELKGSLTHRDLRKPACFSSDDKVDGHPEPSVSDGM